MPVSIYKRKLIEKEQIKAYNMYKQGLSYRQVGALIGKSFNWVRNAVKENEKKKNIQNLTK